jgi:hypothetical protein
MTLRKQHIHPVAETKPHTVELEYDDSEKSRLLRHSREGVNPVPQQRLLDQNLRYLPLAQE